MSEGALGCGAEQTSEQGAAQVAAKRTRYTRPQLSAMAAPYGREYREARRWINIGLRATPPELPPFADPAAMPTWWDRHMKQRVPIEIVTAALNARKPADSAPINDTGVVDPAAERGAEIGLPSIDPSESDDVRFTRSLVTDIQRQLAAAIRESDLEKVTYWSVKHKDAMETLRKQKIEDRAARQSSDLVVSRAEVECEIFAAIKMLVQMQASREKRVREHLLTALPSLDPSLIEHIATALSAVAERELDLFRNLKSVQSIDDVSFRLAA